MAAAFWMLIAVACLVLILGSLKGFAWIKSESGGKTSDQSQPVTKKQFTAAWTDIDAFVADADVWWPFLRSNPYFWVGVVTSTILVLFAAAGGWSLGNGSVFYGALMVLVFCIVNVGQAAVSLSGDRGTADAHEFDASDRSSGSWALLWLLLLLNFFGSFVGAQSVGSTMSTQAQIQAGSVQDLMDERIRTQKALEILNTRRMQAGGLSLEALQTKATETAEAAEREANRVRCASKCEALKAEAAKWKALAADAMRERKLGEHLAVLNDKLSSDSYAKTEANPAGRTLEEMTAGAITEKQFAKHSVMIFLWLVSIIDFMLWLKAGDVTGSARRKEFMRRAEIANENLVNIGLKPRYIVPSQTVIEAGTGEGDTVIMSIEADPDEIISRSDQLKDIQALFRDAMREAEDKNIAFGLLYNIYAERSRLAGREKWMTLPSFIDALRRYCELLKIDITGSAVHGYKLSVAQNAPSEAVAE